MQGLSGGLGKPATARGWRRTGLRAGMLALGAWVGLAALAADAMPPSAQPALGLAGPLPGAGDFLRPFETPLPLQVRGASGVQRVEALHCQDWLQHRLQTVGSDNDAAWRVVRHQTVPCEAMAVLAGARPAARSALPPAFDKALATALYPGALWPALSPQEQRRLAASSASLARSSGAARWSPGPDGSLVLSRPQWRVHLRLLARGDFDADGWEDAAFAWQGEALAGSYADSRLVLLTRKPGDKALRLLDPGPLLAAQQARARK